MSCVLSLVENSTSGAIVMSDLGSTLRQVATDDILPILRDHGATNLLMCISAALVAECERIERISPNVPVRKGQYTDTVRKGARRVARAAGKMNRDFRKVT